MNLFILRLYNYFSENRKIAKYPFAFDISLKKYFKLVSIQWYHLSLRVTVRFLLLPHRKKVPGLNWALSVWTLSVISLLTVLHCLMQLKIIHVRLISVLNYQRYTLKDVWLYVSVLTLWWIGNMSRMYRAPLANGSWDSRQLKRINCVLKREDG